MAASADLGSDINDHLGSTTAGVVMAHRPEHDIQANGRPSPSGMIQGQMGGMSGMMADAQMQHLKQTRGAAFDRMFLQMMIEHHKGAIEMARTELTDGQNLEAEKLAQKIIDAPAVGDHRDAEAADGG